MNPTSTFALQLGAVAVLSIALIRAVMWRLEWLDHRPATPRMKRGRAARTWLLLPATLVAAGCLWWLEHPGLARWIVALCAGAPLLFATERHWSRLLRLDLRVTCRQCGDLGRLTADRAAEAIRLHRDLFGHECMSTREKASTRS
ncbi:MAG: hypothetical protein QOH74_1947 [Gaiellales bacterium]|jgi:hypothetical protein|nr:hypothetical protein [Gaiellales bacterium]